MTAPPPTIHVEAQLIPDVSTHAAVLPGSWYITHGMGKPAQNTYTEVAFTPEVQAAGHPEAVLEEATRKVAADLYGRCWAFTYRPDQYEESIARWRVRRRERVVVTTLEVWA